MMSIGDDVIGNIVQLSVCLFADAAENMPDRMRIVGDELVLYDACKNCADRASDLQVIQCNASNVHGSQFIDAYINVLRKSSAVVSQPTLTNLDSPNPKRVP